MEIEEIYNLSISSLVISPFSTQWSADNHISLLAERGVYILELVPSPMSQQPTIKFSRSITYPSDVLPADAFINEIRSRIWGMRHEDIYASLMETSLTPNLSEVNKANPKIINIAWSPQHLVHPSKCVLAIVTSVGAIELLHKVSTQWFSLCNLSSAWLSIVQAEIQSNIQKSKGKMSEYEALTSNIRRLQGCIASWSEMQNVGDTSFAYLVTGYRNTDIVVWKIPCIMNLTQIINPEVMCIVNLGVRTKVTALCWTTLNVDEYLVTVGIFNGEIYGIKYMSKGQVLKDVFVKKYYAYADRISVSSLQLISRNENGIKLIATKGAFVLLLCIDITGELLCFKHLQLNGFTITGVTCVSTDSVLVAMQNNLMVLLSIQQNNLISTPIKHPVSSLPVQCLGLAHSPMYTMFITATSPSNTYDHLVMREPSTLYMLSIKGNEWNPWHVLQRNKNMPLQYLWECLEVIRMNAAKAADPSLVFPTLPEDLESLHLHELRAVMWMSVISEVCTKKKVIQGIVNIVGEISDAQPLIFIHSACSYLNLIGKRSSLSKDMITSVRLLSLYLEVYLAGEDNEETTLVSQIAQKALNATSHILSTEPEVCNLCGVVISEVPWNANSCSSGHKLPRCAITLLQMTMAQYRSCPICNQIFHPCLDEVYKEVRCLFCNVPALYDYRVLDLKNSVLCQRNLSKQQISLSEISRASGTQSPTEEQLDDEQCSNTHKVTMNGKSSDGDSSKITEIWGEL